MAVKNTDIVVNFYVKNIATGGPQTGDLPNLSIYVIIDGAPGVLVTGPVSEPNPILTPGIYEVTLLSASSETNGDTLTVCGNSATPNVVVEPVVIFTQDAAISSRATDAGVDSTLSGTHGAGSWATADVSNLDAPVSGVPAATWAVINANMTAFVTAIAPAVWTEATRTLTAGTKDSEIDAINTIVGALPNAGALTDITVPLGIIRILSQGRLEFDLTASKVYRHDIGGGREYEADMTDKDGGVVTEATRGPINVTEWTAVP